MEKNQRSVDKTAETQGQNPLTKKVEYCTIKVYKRADISN